MAPVKIIQGTIHHRGHVLTRVICTSKVLETFCKQAFFSSIQRGSFCTNVRSFVLPIQFYNLQLKISSIVSFIVHKVRGKHGIYVA